MNTVLTRGILYHGQTVLKWIFLISTFHRTVTGQNLLPSYQAADRACSSNQQCVQSIGEICWWFYDGCSHGKCMCDPRTEAQGSLGKCGRVRLGGETCEPGDSCLTRMSCKNGRCMCPDNERMTSDAKFCLKDRERLFGETCNPVTNVCFMSMATGYHTTNLACIGKKCRCQRGYKHEGNTCRKLYVSEGLCDQHHHCQGGALCRGRLCVCPFGYFPAAGNTKCIKEGAQYDLGLGAACDEINERRYCAQDLICYRCPKENHYTCVAYRESQTYHSALVGSGTQHSSMTICILLTLLHTAFLSLKSWHWY